MTITLLCILIYMFFEGVTEGLNNLPVKTLWWQTDGFYHFYRTIQCGAILGAIMFWPGFTWLHVASLACIWTGGNALFNRTLVKVVQKSWLAVNNGPFTFLKWSFPYPEGFTGESEFVTLLLFTGAAFIL